MGWIMDNGVDALYDHEGWAAYVTRDGRTTGTSSGTGVLIPLPQPQLNKLMRAAHAAGRAGLENDEMYDLVLWADVVGWQTHCQCGWKGTTWDRDTTMPGQYEGQDAEDAYLPDGTTVAEHAENEWAEHLQPVQRLGAISAAAADLSTARQRLDDAVTAARTSTPPSSWDAIGRAAGITRQSAQERWARTSKGETT